MLRSFLHTIDDDIRGLTRRNYDWRSTFHLDLLVVLSRDSNQLYRESHRPTNSPLWSDYLSQSLSRATWYHLHLVRIIYRITVKISFSIEQIKWKLVNKSQIKQSHLSSNQRVLNCNNVLQTKMELFHRKIRPNFT